MGSIPGSGRSPEEGNGNPFQYSCWENPMERGAWSQLNTAGEGPPALRAGPREFSRTSSHSTLTLDLLCVRTCTHTHTVPSMENFTALVLVCRFLCFYCFLSVISAFLPFRNSPEFLAALWLVCCYPAIPIQCPSHDLSATLPPPLLWAGSGEASTAH